MHEELRLQHPKVNVKYSSEFHTAAAMHNFYRNPQKAPLQMHKLRLKSESPGWYLGAHQSARKKSAQLCISVCPMGLSLRLVPARVCALNWALLAAVRRTRVDCRPCPFTRRGNIYVPFLHLLWYFCFNWEAAFEIE